MELVGAEMAWRAFIDASVCMHGEDIPDAPLPDTADPTTHPNDRRDIGRVLEKGRLS